MMIPITRKEKYINEIVGGGNTAPETPQTREELFFADILGEVVAPSPITRAEKYLAKIANKYSGELPEPVTRIERFLARAAGMNVSTPTPVTREEMFWADYALIVEKEISGIPPLTFNAVAGTLKNYRIYGGTVNGESVGDLVTSGDHAGEYKVPVTVEGKNLAKNNYITISSSLSDLIVEKIGEFIHVSATNNTANSVPYVISKDNNFHAGTYDIVNNSDTTIGYDYKDENGDLVYAVVNANSIKTFNFPAVFTRALNVYKSVLNGDSIDNYFQVMIVKHGDDTDTYEPYYEPVTTDLYLPEPIKIVGDEAEYIDYGKQKQHRVRKNLLPNTATNRTTNGVTFTVNEDGSITCNGAATDTVEIRLVSSFSLPAGNYRLAGAPSGGGVSSYYLRAWYSSGTTTVWLMDDGSGYNFTLTDTTTMNSSIVIRSNQVLNHITFYPMIHKADITDDTYEPYIDNTEVDVILPGIAVTAGTNTLSVGTEVQPSEVYIKYGGAR